MPGDVNDFDRGWDSLYGHPGRCYGYGSSQMVRD